MPGNRAAKAVSPRRTLTQLAGAGETGALHVEGEPGGIVYLTGGCVSYVESSACPGVGELLTTSGRIPAQVWAAATATGEEIGPLLVAQGHLTQGELELCTLGAIYDAAFFVLSPAPARVRFAAGERHQIGRVCQVDAAVLGRELTRRRKLLDDVYPSAGVDTAPLRAAARAPTPRLVVTAAQWELIVHCDGERTAADLARRLGRAGYATLLELRRLAAAGLVTAVPTQRETPAAEPARATSPAPTAHPAREKGPARAARESGPGLAEQEASAARAAREKGAAPRRAATSRRAVAASPGAAGRPAQADARLPRRTPGQQPSGPDPPSVAFADEPDEALLSRIRSGLKAL